MKKHTNAAVPQITWEGSRAEQVVAVVVAAHEAPGALIVAVAVAIAVATVVVLATVGIGRPQERVDIATFYGK